MLTLKRAFLYVTFACIAAAGISRPILIVASAFFTLAVGVICVNTIASLILSGRQRRFHIAAAVCSAIYLWLAMGFGFNGNSHLLLTERLFYAIEHLLPFHESGYPPPPAIGESAEWPSESSYRTEHLLAIWHATWSITIGELAGLMAFHLTDKKSNVTTR